MPLFFDSIDPTNIVSSTQPTQKTFGLNWREPKTSDTFDDWIWSDTKWLSSEQSQSFILSHNADYLHGLDLRQEYNYLLKSISYQMVNTTILDANNRAEIFLKEWIINSSSGTSYLSKVYNSVATQSSTKENISINQVVVPTSLNSIQIKANRVGTAVFTVRGRIIYHLIRK
jgi:hypothetical protein